jgi:hypothetical protein
MVNRPLAIRHGHRDQERRPSAALGVATPGSSFCSSVRTVINHIPDVLRTVETIQIPLTEPRAGPDTWSPANPFGSPTAVIW